MRSVPAPISRTDTPAWYRFTISSSVTSLGGTARSFHEGEVEHRVIGHRLQHGGDVLAQLRRPAHQQGVGVLDAPSAEARLTVASLRWCRSFGVFMGCTSLSVHGVVGRLILSKEVEPCIFVAWGPVVAGVVPEPLLAIGEPVLQLPHPLGDDPFQ